jgi:hypothetical protein
VLTSKDLTVPNNLADVVMTSEIAEGQHTRLRVENQAEVQTNAAFKQPAAKSPEAEPGVEMRCTKAVAHSTMRIDESVIATAEAHFGGGDKAEPFIEGTTVIGRVEDETVELLLARPGDYLLHQKPGEPTSAPFRLGENVND